MWRGMSEGMRFRHLALLLAPLAAPAGARDQVGGFGRWAAFCDEPKKCFAISVPDGSDRKGSLAISFGASTVHADFGRPVRAATMIIDGRRFVLAASGDGATADSRTSRRIVAAMREADVLAIDGVGANGRRFHQRYALDGAPSAIDAAALASLR
jgi:hypothetical protein